MLHLIRRASLACIGIAALASPASVGLMSAHQSGADSKGGQSPRLEFDVISIKPAKEGETVGRISPLAGGQTYVAQNVPVKTMFTLMYRVPASKVVGGPTWFDSDLYDIEAKAPKPSNIDDLHVMFQNLLADRFKLRFHKEIKDLSVYALMLDKAPLKMVRNGTPQDFKVPLVSTDAGGFKGIRVSMSYLSFWLSQPFPELDRPVIDRTGLDGFFDFDLQFTPEIRPGAEGVGTNEDIKSPTIFTALKSQLGLKLEPTKGPVEVYVIDHVEKPSQN